MDRAIYTACRIAKTLDLPVHAWENLHEEGGIYLDDANYRGASGQPGP